MLKWFVDEQIEEEANAQELIDSLKMIKDNGFGLYMLDKELKARVARLAERIEFHLAHKCGEMAAGAIVFSKEYGLLCRTSRAQELLGTIMEG